MPGRRPIQDGTAAASIPGSMARALEATGVLLEEAAVRAIRNVRAIDTGRLRGSITHATSNGVSRTRYSDNAKAGQSDAVSRPSSKYEVWIGTNVEYAEAIEFGLRAHEVNSPVNIKGVGWRYIKTAKARAERPYMRPALDNNRKLVRKLFADALSEGFQRGK